MGRLEGVVQAQLDLARRGTNAGDQTKAAVAYVVIGVSVARYVEDIEEVSPEAEHMIFLPQVKILEQGHVDLSIAWCALGAITRCAERIRSSGTVGADPGLAERVRLGSGALTRDG
jgi:hypothetical protein